MRTITSILFIVSLFFSSCVKEAETNTYPPDADKDLQMAVVVENETPANSEVIKSVRIIVFNNASTNPTLDANVLNTITPTQGSKITTDVRVTANNDKMVVAIVNEPSQLTGKLASILQPTELEDVVFDFANVLNANHTAIATGMPMTGVKRNISVDGTNTSSNPKDVSMTIERAVARVDIYLNQNMTATAQLTTSTQIRLANTYGKGYLVAGTKNDGTRYQTGSLASQNFGHMLTVDNPGDLDDVAWSPTGTVTLQSAIPSSPTVSFYTAERTCSAAADADKLKLEISDINIVGVGPRHASAVINMMTDLPAGETDPVLKEIRRNNVYIINGTVTSKEITFTAQVLSWEDPDLTTPFNEVYYLDVSKHETSINKAIGTDKLVIKTDYTGGWSAAMYNDAAGTIPLSPSGWMSLSASSGAASTSGTEVIITLGSVANPDETRYIKFTAGRKTLVVKVTAFVVGS